MKLLEISKFKKNLKILYLSFKYALIKELAYPFSFIMGVVVDLSYQLAYILTFVFLYQNIRLVAGWSRDEMILLLSIQMFFTEIFVSWLLAFNIRRLPDKIKEGEVDYCLLHPISPMLRLTLGEPYVPVLLVAGMDMCFIIYSVVQLGISLSVLSVLGSIAVFSLGLGILYFVTVIMISWSFYFPDNDTLKIIIETAILYFTAYPRNIYTGVFKVIFYYILPVIYVSSYPAEFLIDGVDLSVIITASFLFILFFALARISWKRAIRSYSSASS